MAMQLEVHPSSITTQDYTNSSLICFWLYDHPLYAGNEDIVYQTHQTDLNLNAGSSNTRQYYYCIHHWWC